MTVTGFKKHRKLIEAWANGADIQYWNHDYKAWIDIETPSWVYTDRYRVKRYEPKPYERVLVLDLNGKWYEKIFVGWDGAYPLTIVENKKGEPVIELGHLKLEDWEAIKPLNE